MTLRTSGRRARRGERGAALVEFTFIAVLLVSLVLGVIEIGSAWGDYQSLAQASRAGARVTSQVATDGRADVEGLLAIEAALGNLSDNVNRVVVFEADADGRMPSACRTASPGFSGGANCNVYGATEMANLTNTSFWGSGTSCGSADGNWCPTSRSNILPNATYLGVRVEVERDFLTGFFGGGSHSMGETTVMRVEPVLDE